jgi:hypothetical protein
MGKTREELVRQHRQFRQYKDINTGKFVSHSNNKRGGDKKGRDKKGRDSKKNNIVFFPIPKLILFL